MAGNDAERQANRNQADEGCVVQDVEEDADLKEAIEAYKKQNGQ